MKKTFKPDAKQGYADAKRPEPQLDQERGIDDQEECWRYQQLNEEQLPPYQQCPGQS